MMKYFISLFACLLAFSSLQAEPAVNLVVYPVPEGVPVNHSFTVKVRSPGGEWKEVSCYEVLVGMHHPFSSSMACFDFANTVEVSVTSNRRDIRSARIRPLSYGMKPEVNDHTLTFTLTEPRNLSIEINGDTVGNLHLFASSIETDRPDPHDPNVIYFGPGLHAKQGELRVSSGKTVYLAGGAVVQTGIVCDYAENVRILGRGVLYHRDGGAIQITHSKNVVVDGLAVVDPNGYAVTAGESKNVTIRNLKSFSSKGWGDGIDLFCCSDVLIDGVFMRNSDDCIAIYGHRWKFYGDSRNITVQNSTLWADVAHPVNIGTHGDEVHPETLENLTFSNIDILEHNEPQIDYQGCIAINVSDENLVRHVRVEDLRVEDFTKGQLLTLRVAYNRMYAKAPGRGIEDVRFKDVTYNGTHANLSLIAGYDDTREVKDVVFANLTINGVHIHKADKARFFVGEHVQGIAFLAPDE